MRKLLFTLIMSVFVLSACAQGVPVELTPTKAEVPSAATEEPTTNGGEDKSAAVVPATCTARGPQPTPNPTVEAMLPSIGEDDWAKGPGDAYITLVEYGDFQ